MIVRIVFERTPLSDAIRNDSARLVCDAVSRCVVDERNCSSRVSLDSYRVKPQTRDATMLDLVEFAAAAFDRRRFETSLNTCLNERLLATRFFTRNESSVALVVTDRELVLAYYGATLALVSVLLLVACYAALRRVGGVPPCRRYQRLQTVEPATDVVSAPAPAAVNAAKPGE